jgi:hypothetical protein
MCAVTSRVFSIRGLIGFAIVDLMEHTGVFPPFICVVMILDQNSCHGAGDPFLTADHRGSPSLQLGYWTICHSLSAEETPVDNVKDLALVEKTIPLRAEYLCGWVDFGEN